MAVAMLIDNPTGSQEAYEELRNALSIDGPIGGVVHIAGPSPAGGWRVIEVWDSVEEASLFLKEKLIPALASARASGKPPEPQFWPVHSCLTVALTDDHESRTERV